MVEVMVTHMNTHASQDAPMPHIPYCNCDNYVSLTASRFDKKAYADDELNATQVIISTYDMTERISGIDKMLATSSFSFSKWFLKASIFWFLKT